jgi:hypothetical protein
LVVSADPREGHALCPCPLSDELLGTSVVVGRRPDVLSLESERAKQSTTVAKDPLGGT